MEYNQQNLGQYLLQFLLDHPQNAYSVQEIMTECQHLTRYQVEYRLKKLAEQEIIICHKQCIGIVTRHYWQAAQAISHQVPHHNLSEKTSTQ